MDIGLKLLSSRFSNHFTRAVGWAAGRHWPQPLLRASIRLYSRAYGVNLQEAAPPPGGYPTFLDFFTRELRTGARPVDPDPASLVSPADSTVTGWQRLEKDAVVQAKGLTYSLEELVGSAEWARRWEGGSYLNFYLHPADYHRFHAPADLQILEAVHLPGRLLPVNEWSRRQPHDLFAKNERIVVRAAMPGGEMLLVLVAATSVGRVRLVFDPTLTTHDGATQPERRTYSPPVPLARGAELGRFELGSTVLVLIQPGLCVLDERPPNQPIRMGERVGTLTHVGAGGA